jgi:hypothetical protein
LIRINIREPQIKIKNKKEHVSISLGGKIALERIKNQIIKLENDEKDIDTQKNESN